VSAGCVFIPIENIHSGYIKPLALLRHSSFISKIIICLLECDEKVKIPGPIQRLAQSLNAVGVETELLFDSSNDFDLNSIPTLLKDLNLKSVQRRIGSEHIRSVGNLLSVIRTLNLLLRLSDLTSDSIIYSLGTNEIAICELFRSLMNSIERPTKFLYSGLLNDIRNKTRMSSSNSQYSILLEDNLELMQRKLMKCLTSPISCKTSEHERLYERPALCHFAQIAKITMPTYDFSPMEASCISGETCSSCKQEVSYEIWQYYNS